MVYSRMVQAALVVLTAGVWLASAATAQQATAPAVEELPWLAPSVESSKPSTDAAKKAKGPVKCDEQGEDDCRAASNCAWVAHIAQPDGSFAPAKCAEKKIPGTEKKPKTTAAKPKPKPKPPEEKPAAAAEPAAGTPAPAEQNTSPPKSDRAEPAENTAPAASVAAGGSTAPAESGDAGPSAIIRVPAEIAAPAAQSSTVSPAVIAPIEPKSP